MVPTADLANHSHCNAKYALQASQGFFELRSRREIKEGEAVCVTYGQDMTNAELMCDYGFIVPGNPRDRLDFTVTTKPTELLFEAPNAALLTEEEGPQLLSSPLFSSTVSYHRQSAAVLCLLLALMYLFNGV